LAVGSDVYEVVSVGVDVIFLLFMIEFLGYVNVLSRAMLPFEGI
jgi:hypothetical protein